MDFKVTNKVVQVQVPFYIELMSFFVKMMYFFEKNNGLYQPFEIHYKNLIFVIKSCKYKTFKLGICNDKKAFKNALHLSFDVKKDSELEFTSINFKLFSTGMIHLSGMVTNKHIKCILLLFQYIKNTDSSIVQKIHVEDNLLKCGNFILTPSQDFKTFIFSGWKVDNDYYIFDHDSYNCFEYNPSTRLFYERIHIKSRTVYNNILSQKSTYTLKMIDRKNLPKGKSYFIKDNQLFLNYKNTLGGVFNYTNPITSIKLPENYTTNASISWRLFIPNGKKIETFIHNLNVSMNITIKKSLSKQNIVDTLKNLNIECEYNSDKHQAIHARIWYLDNDIYYHAVKDASLIKFQIQETNKITFTCKDESIVENIFNFLKCLVNKINETKVVIQEKQTFEEDYVPKDISELYHLMKWSESIVC